MDSYSWKETWSDELFLKGYLAGIKGREEIEKAFKKVNRRNYNYTLCFS